MSLSVKYLEDLAKEYKFGELLKSPTRVVGGFCHDVYKISTEKGEFLIKLVANNNETNLKFWKDKDVLEEKLIKNKIPAIYSLKFNGSRVQCFKDKLIYIYNYVEGKVIKGEKATVNQTKQMAKVSALVNNIDIIESKEKLKEININWQQLIEYSKDKNSYIHNMLKDNVDMLKELEEKGNKYLRKMKNVSALCHCDMDYKNVMWIDNKFRLIDMDSLRYYNPYMLLFKNALVWSGYEESNIDYKRFALFIKTYFKYANLDSDINLEDYYYATMIGLEWLEVNVKRALKLVGDSQLMFDIGLDQTKITISQIRNYYNNKDKIINALNE